MENDGTMKTDRINGFSTAFFSRKAAGQLSIEFMLIVVVSLVYLNSVIFPQVDFGATMLNEIDGLSQSRTAANQVVNTINALSMQAPDAQQTLRVVIPRDANINCLGPPDNRIEFTYSLRGEPSEQCQLDTPSPPGTGKKTRCARSFTPSLAGSQSLSCNGFPLLGPQVATVVVRIQPPPGNPNQISVTVS